jgi:Fic family protein
MAKKTKSKGKLPPQASLLAEDKRDAIGLMEPTRISESSRWRGEINELALDLTYRAAEFKAGLPTGVRDALRELVRNMNCYYSNLIEGHRTHPIAIERALNQDFDSDPKRRNLQLEAKAHVTVQRWIDEGNLPGEPTSEASIREIHRRFVECLPEELRWVEHPLTGKPLPVVPGEYREDFVKVGQHIPISPGAVPRFMRRYEEAYSRLGRAETIMACAAAHHRFAWIHPFVDGNGRVVRLVSHAIMLNALDTGGVWSIARGLARSVDKYKGLLAQCDLPRRNDLDGRGHLSEEALVEFTKYFLEACIDQVNFMKELMQPDRLRARVLTWAEEETRLGSLNKGASRILEAVLFRGELPRSDVQQLIGSDRSAARIASQLNSFGALTSSSSRSPWRLALPATLAPRWFPGLYPPNGA